MVGGESFVYELCIMALSTLIIRKLLIRVDKSSGGADSIKK